MTEIEDKKKKLMKVNDPTTMMAGGIDVDAELHKLAYNLKVLTELKALCGFEVVKLEQHYNQRTMQLATEYSQEFLSGLGIVRSDKFKYIKMVLNQEYADLENMRIKSKYFSEIWDTYQEWINIYKKTRLLGE